MNTQIGVPFVQIEPTTRCNFICGFCAGRHMDQSDMDIERFDEIISKIHGLKHIELQGEGEPLLNPDYFKMVQRARDYNPDLSISLITNGSFFNQKNNELILAAGIQKIFVSIESADNQHFKTIRGGKLERVVRGIKSLIELRQSQTGSLPKIGFAITVLRQTVPAITDIVRLYEELEMDGGINLQLLQTMPQYNEYYSATMSVQTIRQSDYRELQQIINANPGIQSLLRQGATTQGFYSELYSGKGTNWHICPWLEKGLFITVSGMAVSCCFIKKSEVFGLGNIEDTDISILLERREQLLNSLKGGTIPSNCEGCGLARQAVNR